MSAIHQNELAVNKIGITGILLLAMAAVFAPAASAQSLHVSSDSYAAIAYSPETGFFGYSYNDGSRWAAEKAALKRCQGSDARIVCWVNRGFCVLALGDDKSCWGAGWSYGDGASNTEAINRALTECRRRTTGARLILCLVSDGQYVEKH